ncbi:hypothetical protein Ae201684_008950 [Aphanomyces euteiches]|uniref:RAVE complex protein Rav1 C-terminal domain-containing protein n=1 Tax=Aphanomyces euteiches TaxID=100861 RepID=A0A6G0X353_9STRA|nr:hypothetical protein Ae201684_008950 [Aphanomyces euteiches]
MISLWKVVDDAVTVYSNRSFQLDAMTHLFDVCALGRYVATTSSPHARLVKVWSLHSWTTEMTKPFCVFLGHSHSITSIEWMHHGIGAIDNATLLTLDRSGEVTFWREDSNAATFAFIRMFLYESRSESVIRSCGSIVQQMSPQLSKWGTNDMPVKLWKSSAPKAKHHDLYTHTMDRFQTKSSKALGFSYRPGATADSHEGEKFIQGNIALPKCSIAYLVYAIQEDGGLRVWRVEFTSFLTSTPRVTQVTYTLDLHKELKDAELLKMSSVDFSVQSSSFQMSALLHTSSHGVASLLLQFSDSKSQHSLTWKGVPDLVTSAGSLFPLEEIQVNEPNSLLLRDTHRTLFGLDAPTECITMYEEQIQACVAVSLDLVFCVATESKLLAVCNRDEKIMLDSASQESEAWNILSLALGREDTERNVRLLGVSANRLFLWRIDVEVPSQPRVLEKHDTASLGTAIHGSYLSSCDSAITVSSTAANSTIQFWKIEDELVSMKIVHEIDLAASIRQLKVDRMGRLAILLSEPIVQIQYLWDPLYVHTWPVDSSVHTIAWMQHQVVCLSTTTLYVFKVDGTPLVNHDVSPGIPNSVCIEQRSDFPLIFVSHGSFVTKFQARDPSIIASTIPDANPWTPIVLLHFILQGKIKAAERVLQTLVDAITQHETQSYVAMKETRARFPWMAWKNVCLDKLGKDDRMTFSQKKDTAAMLFAPRVSSVATATKKSTDFQSFFTSERLSKLSEPAMFQSICKMLKGEEIATDFPGLKFSMRLLWDETNTYGLCAEALLWARLTKMDIFSLPYFQTLTMEWKNMLDLRLPFWLDDIQRLKQKTEQVAQREYAASKDPFSIALYYVLLGKTKLLSGLFRVAKELKIAELLANDFTEERWKSAAIKNAFVLKSKQRYALAATFFLLGGKVYEAASIAESADPTFVLSFLILRLSEPSSLSDLGPTTQQFIQAALLTKAKSCNDVYMQCLCSFLVNNRLDLDPLFTKTAGSMTCAFQTTSSTYWRVLGSTLYNGCQLVQHARHTIREEQEASCISLHCMAASRLHAQGHYYLSYSVLADMAEVFSSYEYLPQWTWAQSLRHEISLVCLEHQLQTICPPFLESLDESLRQQNTAPVLLDLQDKVELAWSFFPQILPSEVAPLLRRCSPIAWMLMSRWLQNTSQPVLDQIAIITSSLQAISLVPKWVLEAALTLVQYLHLVEDEEPGLVRVATAAIYTALAVVFPVYVTSLPGCCLVRLLSLMCPQKEITSSGYDQCLTCLEFKPRLMPSLRRDLPYLYSMIQLLLSTSISKTPSSKCPYWSALMAAVHDTMGQHVQRLTDQLTLAQQLLSNWKDYYTPRVVSATSCSCTPSCEWHKLFQLLVPSPSLEFDPVQRIEPPEMFTEVIYRSDVPGEHIRAMCCNNQQKNTVVFTNGRFIYRALAKKPPKTSSDTSNCQLHVNAKFTPPTAFFASESDQVKPPTPSVISPQPDSKGTGSYKPIAVQSHPSLPLFCSGTVKGTIEVWRFDETSSCNVFEHQVLPATNALAPLTTPRRDVHRIRFANTGHILGACDALGYVYLWNFASEGAVACYAHLQCHNRGTRDFAFLNASSCVASVGLSTKKKNLCLWDTLLPPHKALICAPQCHPLGAASVVFSSRHQLLISGGESGSLNIFDVRRQRVLYTVSTAHDSAITALALHPKGHCVLSGSATGDVKIWSLPLFRELSNWTSGKPKQPSFLGDASSFATTAPTFSGITDTFATEDFFYACSTDGIIQRYQTPVTTALPV